MPDFYFRGTLVEYWQAVHAEWCQYSHGFPHARCPMAISHPFKDHPPAEYEEVTLEFLDDCFSRAPRPRPVSVPGVTRAKPPTFVFPPDPDPVPVTVRAASSSDGTLVSLTVHIGKAAHEEFGKSALSKWIELKNTWLYKGWLLDPLAHIAKPEKPSQPETTSNLYLWLDWYHSMLAAVYYYTLK